MSVNSEYAAEFYDPLLECLVVYCKLQGKPFSHQAFIAGLPIKDKKRLTPELFIRAASRANIKVSIKKKPISSISNLVLPCILSLKNNQACLLEKIEGDLATVIMSEAVDGRKTLAIKEIEQEYLGYVVYLTEIIDSTNKKEDIIKHEKGHWFWSTFLDNKAIYRDVIIASVVINIFVIANPLFVMNVYDRIVPNNAIESLWALAIGITIVYLFDILLKYLRTYFLEIAGKKSDVIMSSKLFEQTLGLTMANRTGSIGVFASNLKEFDSIRNFFTSGTISSFVDMPFVIIFLLVIFFIAGNLVFVPIAIIVIILIYSFLMKGPIQKSVEATYESSSQKNAILIETLTSIETIKSLGVEAKAQWKWEQAVGEMAKASLKSRMMQSAIGRVTGFMQQISTVAIILAGVYLIQAGNLTMGGLIATVMLSQRAIGPMGQFANLTASYQQTKTALESLNEIMEREVERPVDKKFIQHPHFEGEIEFNNVVFTYPNETKSSLNGVSFKIKASEKVGIIGRIGSGKSTIQKLILGFYKPDSGSILIDGIDITQLDPAELRKNINYIPQEVVLFSGDVKENISYRAPYIDDEFILKAAKIAGVDDFIKTHPSGYALAVNEGGTSLSGGQRQSIGIARALLTPSPIYLFDEPTNAMDSSTEATLIQRLKENTINNTLIVVTHKMSILKLVNKIIVIENGNVVADGNKETVLEALKSGRISKKEEV